MSYKINLNLIFIFNILININLYSHKIIIDPGHGGDFVGNIGCENIKEKDINLEIALRVSKILKKNNYKVILTRTKDISLDSDLITDLKKRVDLSNLEKPDIFVSIHFNCGHRNLHGFEIYVPRINIFPIKSYNLAANIHYELNKIIKPVWSGVLGNLNLSDRGIRAANFNVLKNHNCPAILLELEYLTNNKSAKLIKTEEFKQKLARAVANGIINYFKA